MSPKPQTIRFELARECEYLFGTLTRFLSPNDERLVELSRRADLLMRIDPAAAYLAKAHIHLMSGQHRPAIGALTNASARHAERWLIAANTVAVHNNFMHATLVQGYLDRYIQDVPNARNQLHGSCLCSGAFGFFNANHAKLVGAGVEFVLPELVPDMLAAAAILNRHGFTDADCARVIDVAGELVRERRLLWMGDTPQLTVDHDLDVVAMRFKVDVSFQEATQMTLELGRTLDARGIPEGPLNVSFSGTHA